METKQTEVKQNGAKKPAPKKGKNPFRSNKFKRGGMATLMTVVFVAHCAQRGGFRPDTAVPLYGY